MLNEECPHIQWPLFPELHDMDTRARWERIHCMLLIGQASLVQNPHVASLDGKMDLLRQTMEQKVDQLNQILMPRVLNSSRKGKDYENRMEVALEGVRGYVFERTTGVAHHGDGLLVGGGGLRIMVELKDYVNAVPTAEIEKLKRDMETQGVSHGMMLTAGCKVTGRRDFDVEVYLSPEGRRRAIVYVARTQESGERMDLIHSALALHETLSGFIVPMDHGERARDRAALEHIMSQVGRLNEVLEEIDAFTEAHFKMEQDIRATVSRAGARFLQSGRKIRAVVEELLCLPLKKRGRAETQYPDGFEGLLEDSCDCDEYRVAVERLALVLGPLGMSLKPGDRDKTFLVQPGGWRLVVKPSTRKRSPTPRMTLVQDSPPIEVTLTDDAFTLLPTLLRDYL